MTPTRWINRFSFATFLTVAATSLAVPGPTVSADDATLSPALKAVQGVWVSKDGAEIDAKWTIKHDDITATVNGDDYIGKLKLDDEARPHPSWTIELTDGPGDVQGKHAKGVYKLEGEKLVVNISAPGRDRPADFEPEEDEIYLFELEKEKKG